MSEAMTKEEFVQGMKTLREEAAAKEAAKKAKQREYQRRYSERKKAEKAEKAEEAAEAVADPEDSEPEEGVSSKLARVTISEKGLTLDFAGVRLSGEEAAMLSLYIKDTICWALECDRYFNETMIFDLVHLADRLGGAE